MNNKSLISWIAYANDFENGVFKPTGPTATLHAQALQEYDRHYCLLSWAEGSELEELREAHLRTYLTKNNLTATVSLVHLPLLDVTSYNEIRGRVEQWLASSQVGEADVFVSPGTPQMQVVWYMLAASGSFSIKLFQTRRERQRRKDAPFKEYISLEFSREVGSLVQREATVGRSVLTPDYLTDTPSLVPIYARALRIAQTDRSTTLILGESGTGKENLAHFIHRESERRQNEFIVVNCSALTDSLLESRLFGFKKGAFTGADQDTPGYFEKAGRGTIFLDEIGDISPLMQQSLLRVIQSQEITRIGETKARPIDVRIIAATHRDLSRRCEEGLFRWDLYYRLAVAELELPSLRQRGQAELDRMIGHFLKTIQKRFKRPRPLRLQPETHRRLLMYPFPGNVRELENLIERLYVFCDDEVRPDDLPVRFGEANMVDTWQWITIERTHLQRAMAFFNGNISQVAEAVGYSRTTLYQRLKAYGLEPRDGKPQTS